MATYFHQHHRHNHHHSHHGNPSDIITPQAADGGLQTLILMNHPNFVGYSETPHAPTLYHAPPPLLPQLVGVPLHSPSESYAHPPPPHAQQHYAAWAQRESPRAQQGLSLTLSSNHQNHSFSRAAHPEHDHLQPSPSGGSDSPAATVASAGGDVAALMTPSKYLKAAQELLEEVVNVSVDRGKSESVVKKIKTSGESPPDDSAAGDGPKEAAELSPADRQELQMKKAKLINLLDEVEQRQRQYQQQMQSVVASFEQVAGANSARTYTSLALKTISSQFRCLRGAISGQIRATNKALGEGEGEGGSSSSSRLKMLDHHMRQQRALQQLGMIQNNAWRPQRGLPEKAVSVLRAWLFEHFLHPYPKDSDKIMLAKQTGLSRSQVSNWFINARVRLWKPMIEEMYAEEVKEHQQQNGTDNKDQHENEEDDHHHNLGDHDEATKAGEENHSSSNVKGNDPFALVESEAQGGSCLKKQRNNNDFTFPDSELFNNGCKEEVVHHQTKRDDDCSMMPGGSGSGFIGGLVSYPIGEIGRFGEAGQFPANFSGNGVSLTLGLPHCESLSLQGNNQAFLHNNSEIDQYRGRLEMGQLNPNPSHSGSAYAAQLLHDFVA